MNRAIRELEANYQGTRAALAEATGISISTLNRIAGNDDLALRDINVSQIFALAREFNTTAAELVQRALYHAEKIRKSEAGATVTHIRGRDMTTAQIEQIERHAANTDPEADTDEHFD